MLVFQNIFIQKFNHFENIDFTLFDIYIACKFQAQFGNKRQSTWFSKQNWKVKFYFFVFILSINYLCVQK